MEKFDISPSFQDIFTKIWLTPWHRPVPKVCQSEISIFSLCVHQLDHLFTEKWKKGYFAHFVHWKFLRQMFNGEAVDPWSCLLWRLPYQCLNEVKPVFLCIAIWNDFPEEEQSSPVWMYEGHYKELHTHQARYWRRDPVQLKTAALCKYCPILEVWNVVCWAIFETYRAFAFAATWVVEREVSRHIFCRLYTIIELS